MIQANTIMAMRKKPRPKLDAHVPVKRSAVKKIIDYLQLMQIDGYDRRAEVFIGYCKMENYSDSTTQLYFEMIRKAGHFGDTELRPDHKIFGPRGHPHTRVCSRAEFALFFEYLNQNLNETTAPLLLPVLTGLRSFEVIQLDTRHVQQLLDGQEEIELLRKNTSPSKERILWQPTYSTHLMDFVVALNTMYEPLIQVSLQLNTPQLLFPIKRQTLNARFRAYFYRATGVVPPHGFGVHSCRNMLAAEMAATSDNITAIQKYLQHSHFKTTQKYIKSDFTHTSEQFNKLTNHKFATLQNIIDLGS